MNLFTIGDCTDLNTWSSLPYYFYQNLRARPVAVRPINLVPSESTSYRAFARLMALRARAFRFVRPRYRYELLRTTPYQVWVNRRLRSIAKQHSDVDLNVFLSFTFSTYRYVGVPVVHYCDRTYEQHLEETGRTPTRTDRAFMRIDQRNIENADMVLSTNQTCCDFITRRYRPKRAFCLTPGINTEAAVRDPERLINEKENSTDILFIGTGAHQRGADILIRAFKLFNDRRHRRFTLHIVGIKPRDLPEELRAPDHCIRFYGYLDRSVPADLERYNNLLRSAKMFVMPTRPAPFPGVISEVQLHCTPVIGSNVSDMSEVLAHGRDSVLVDGLEPHDYATQMDRLVLDVPAWRQMALNGYVSRRNSTWTNTVETFLSMIRDTNLVATGR